MDTKKNDEGRLDVGKTANSGRFDTHIGQPQPDRATITTLVRATKELDEEMWMRERETKNSRRSTSRG